MCHCCLCLRIISTEPDRDTAAAAAAGQRHPSTECVVGGTDAASAISASMSQQWASAADDVDRRVGHAESLQATGSPAAVAHVDVALSAGSAEHGAAPQLQPEGDVDCTASAAVELPTASATALPTLTAQPRVIEVALERRPIEQAEGAADGPLNLEAAPLGQSFKHHVFSGTCGQHL